MASANPSIGWELYRSFLGVLKEGSLSGAARALGVAQPTIGRHIAALEKSLGLALFTRSPTGLLPTESALALMTHAESMESTAAALERTAASQGAGVKGVVRITASDVIGVEVLPPVVAHLRQEHPDLKIELVLTNRVQDLLRREADIAVRMTHPKQETLIARRIGRIEVGLHATRQYLANYGAPASVAELTHHTLIGFDQETAFIRSARKHAPLLNRDNVFSSHRQRPGAAGPDPGGRGYRYLPGTHSEAQRRTGPGASPATRTLPGDMDHDARRPAQPSELPCHV